jgi:N-dimethylarginine dimethylaminohydrolase
MASGTKYARPTILMCPPRYYGIEYEINPWMSRSRQSDSDAARAQWHALYGLLSSLGADLRQLEPAIGLPDLVFTANAGLVWRSKVFLSRFRHEARRGETSVDEAWFRAEGFEVVALPPDWSFEGAGDALFCGDTLFAGYIIRSDAGAMQWVAQQIGCRVIPLQLVDEFYYHLDTCFCPLSDGVAIYHPSAFDAYARRALEQHVKTLIPVDPDEAARFCCNAVVIGTHVVLNTGCPQLEAELQARGFTTHSTPLDEFIKAGGSAKCLTLRLDGEDAAVWP